MKHFILCFLAAIYIFSALGVSSAYGFSNPVIGDPSGSYDSCTIIGIFDINQDIGELPVIHLDDQISKSLPKTVIGITGTHELVACPVVWDASTVTNPGKQVIHGQVSAPDGYRLASGALASVKVTVAIYKDTPVVFLPLISDPWSPTKILPLDGSLASLQLTAPFELQDKDGDIITGPIKWDFSNLNVHKTGMYTIYGTAILPEGVAFEKTATPISQNIYVMKCDQLDLGGFSIWDESVICNWLMTIDTSLATLEASLDGAHWGTIDSILPGYSSYTLYANHLQLNTKSLQKDIDYYFRIKYNGIFTDSLHVRILETTGAPVVDWGGNRDGGGNNQQMPPVSQPAPGNTTKTEKETAATSAKSSGKAKDTSTKSKSQQNTGIIEKETATHAVYSGLRLRVLCELHDKVVFNIGDITVSFDNDAFLKFNLSNKDTFDLHVVQTDKNSVYITVKINGTAIKAIPSASVRMPYEAEDSKTVFYVTRESEEHTQDAVFDGSSLSFTINRTGTWYIHETPIASEQPSDSETPATSNTIFKIMVVAFSVILLGCIGMVIRRRFKCRK